MTNEELIETIGGSTSFSGTMISSLCKMLSLLVEMGRQVGSGFRYLRSGNKCS